MDFNTNTEAGQIAELTKAALAFNPQIIEGPGGRSYLLTSPEVSAKDITPAGAGKTFRPDHIAQAPTIQTAQSLGDYLKLFKTASSVLFANIAQNQIVGAIDYHAADAAELVAHKATLTLPFSTEWKLWNEIDGKMMSQLDFARFLDENQDDISSPRGADLVEIVKDLIAVDTANSKASIRINSDNVDFSFTASTDARSGSGGQLEIPKEFELRIPVYFGEEPLPMKARLRWKNGAEGVTFGIVLLRKEQARQDEFKRVVREVSATADLPVFYGALA